MSLAAGPLHLLAKGVGSRTIAVRQIAIAEHNQEWRQIGPSVDDGRGLDVRFGILAERNIEERSGRNGEQTAQRQRPPDSPGRQAFRLEIAIIGGQQGSEMAAGGMTADEEFIIAAAVFVNVFVSPG